MGAKSKASLFFCPLLIFHPTPYLMLHFKASDVKLLIYLLIHFLPFMHSEIQCLNQLYLLSSQLFLQLLISGV